MLLGRRGNYLQGDGEINALFSGFKGSRNPPPPPRGTSIMSVRVKPKNAIYHLQQTTIANFAAFSKITNMA